MPETVVLFAHPSIDGLFVTAEGRVFSELALSGDSQGYPLVRVLGGQLVRRHTLMAETFLGSRPDGAVVRHLNGVPGDDRPENLAWGTQAQNCQDTVTHGKSTKGIKNSQAKLNEAQVIEIRKRRAAGESGRSLAKEFSVSEASICDLMAGRTWKWLV